MSGKERYLLLKYIESQRTEVENDLIYAKQMILRNGFDPVDCMELIIAVSRFHMYQKMSYSIFQILKMNM
jgi:hypothetical protein